MKIHPQGPTNSGKSFFCGQLINERARMFADTIESIFYCAKFHTSIPKNVDAESITFLEGLPTEEMFENKNLGNVLYVLDDLLDEAFKSNTVSKMFCEGRHRR